MIPIPHSIRLLVENLTADVTVTEIVDPEKTITSLQCPRFLNGTGNRQSKNNHGGISSSEIE
jgi:hypothetical protein